MQNFVESAISDLFKKILNLVLKETKLQRDSIAFFHDQRIAKFKFYIITNCVLSDRVKTIHYTDIYDKKS